MLYFTPIWMAKFSALILAVSISSLAVAESAHDPKYPVPTTVSKAAQAKLAEQIVAPPASATPKTPEQWQQAKRLSASRYSALLTGLISNPAVKMEKKKIAGVVVREVVPKSLPAAKADKVLINVHGGAYVFFGGDISAMEGVILSGAGNYRVVAVDYRMPPEHPFPAAVDDAVAVYKELLKTYAPENIGIFGTSAGGGLAAAMTLAARDAGLPLPAAVVMNTPWSDLSKTGDSYFTNAGVDPVLTSYEGTLEAAALLYAGKEDLKHPLVSPVYADYSKGFPPALLVTGTRDLLLSCTVRLHRKLRAANIPAELHVFEAMWHGFSDMPEGKEALREMVAFFDKQLGQKAP